MSSLEFIYIQVNYFSFQISQFCFRLRVDVSIPVAQFTSTFAKYLDRSISTLAFPPKRPYDFGKH